MKILITGADGMLGTDIAEALDSLHELVLTDIISNHSRIVDITNTENVMELMSEIRPNMVIHCAAYTDVDGCERNSDKAFRVNAFGTWNLAAACRALGASIAYISTDFVFDGEKKEPYTEYDQVNPLGSYGASKLAGETHVRSLCPRHYIIRTAWLYGIHGKSFPHTILSAAKTRKELRVVADQIGSPTFTADLAEMILQIINSPLYGTYHVTNKGSCSWYEFAKKTLSLAGMDDVEVKAITTDEWLTPTKRPKYSVLRHLALENQGLDNIRSWEEALAEFISMLQ